MESKAGRAKGRDAKGRRVLGHGLDGRRGAGGTRRGARLGVHEAGTRHNADVRAPQARRRRRLFRRQSRGPRRKSRTQHSAWKERRRSYGIRRQAQRSPLRIASPTAAQRFRCISIHTERLSSSFARRPRQLRWRFPRRRKPWLPGSTTRSITTGASASKPGRGAPETADVRPAHLLERESHGCRREVFLRHGHLLEDDRDSGERIRAGRASYGSISATCEISPRLR